jgi:hypothetical protein
MTNDESDIDPRDFDLLFQHLTAPPAGDKPAPRMSAERSALAAELIGAESMLADAVSERFGAPVAIVLETEADAEALIRDLGGDVADLVRRVQTLRAAWDSGDAG